MFAIRDGLDPAKPCIGLGSHLDTQPTGGRFDGILGVCAALEVVRTLNDANIETSASICIINWTNEEGARFPPSMMGSAVYADLMSLAVAHDIKDASGVSVAEALDRIGYRGPDQAKKVELSSFLELHIEQGPVLEARKTLIGVVEGAYGLAWYNGVVRGFESHAGSTPMGLRRDALAALAEMILAIERSAAELAPRAVGTVGEVMVEHASRNVIPGEIRFTLDCRTADRRTARELDRLIRLRVDDIAKRRNVSVELSKILDKAATRFDGTLIELIDRTAERLGYQSMRMVSGAGHDACNLNGVVPTAMIFIPCKDGISHNESEEATRADCAAGANVLFHAALELANAGREPM
jgi:N-carbamoyl-L-amino-acid hydrolase